MMELTKQDKKHIDEKVIEVCQRRIDAIDIYHEQVTKVANNET